MRSEIAIAEGGRLAPGASDRRMSLAFVVLLSLPALIGLGGSEAGARGSLPAAGTGSRGTSATARCATGARTR